MKIDIYTGDINPCPGCHEPPYMIRAEEHETPTGETLFIFGCFNKFCHGHLEYLDGIPVGILVAQWRRTPYEAAEAWNHGEFE